MNGWSTKEVSIAGKIIGASETNTAVTREFPITAGGALHLVVAIDVTATTVAAGITAKLQTAIDGIYQDAKTVAISGNGRFYIKLNAEVAGDQGFLPLLNGGRIVVSSGAGDTTTISAVNILQEL